MPYRISGPGALAAAALVAACSQGEAPPPKPQAAPPVTPAPTVGVVAPASGEIDPALRDRLARQEAAARMFERKVLEPPPPKASEAATPAIAPATRAEPARAEAPKSEPPKPGPVKAAPPPAERPKVASAKAAAPAPKPPPARSEAPAAKAQAPAPAVAQLLARVDPAFPREAIQAGVEQGSVKARMTLDEKGAVTRVDVLESNPRRVFDRAVVRALSQWKYSDGAAGRTVDMEVDFRR